VLQTIFASKPSNGSNFLKVLSNNIADDELAVLEGVGGFGPPNNFEFEKILALLREHRFPVRDFNEYVWAIYECGYEMIATLPAWPRLYVSSLYLYCDDMKLGSMEIESDYYYMNLVGELEEGVSDCSFQFLKFLEWHFKNIRAGEENYFPLLSWLLLRRLRGDADEQVYDNVMQVLVANNYSSDLMRIFFTNSDRGMNSWLDIHKRIPLRYRYSSHDYERIICGV
jgi:hypothetical protein